MSLIRNGWREEDVLEMEMDKFNLYIKHTTKHTHHNRYDFVCDVTASIGGAFSKEGITAYLKHFKRD